MKNFNYSVIYVILFVIFIIACEPFIPKRDLKKKNDLDKKRLVFERVAKEKKVEVTKPVSASSSVVQVKKVEPLPAIVGKIADDPLPLVVDGISILDKDISLPIDEDVKLNVIQNNELVNLLLDNIYKQKDKLKKEIDLFNKKYLNKKVEFAMLQLPLHKIKSLIDSAATQSVIYETLGYSQVAIGKFKFILNILDLDQPFSRDVSIICDFISYLNDVSSLTKKVLYEDFNLNTLDLEQIVINNGKDGIDSLCRRIDQFMQLREQFIIKVQNALDSAYNNNSHLRSKKTYKVYKKYKDVVLDILESEMVSPNGTLVRAFEDLKIVADEIYAHLKI